MKQADNLYEFRQYILEDLIERGYKYIARDEDEELYAYSDKPTKKPLAWGSKTGKLRNISLLSPIFTEIKWEDVKPFRIIYVVVKRGDRLYGVRKD